MVNVKELRVGNCIYNEHNKIIKVTFQVLEAIYHHRGIYNYIPLSEDILLNCGAIKKPKFNCFPSFNLKGLQINYINDMWIEYVSQVEITGLHHLQNIFYFRMSEELSVVANGS
jgi:hypothetical protein